MKKPASSRLRPGTGLRKPQNRPIWCLIWANSGHRGSFSTGCGVFGKRTAAGSLLGSLRPRPRSAPKEAAKSRCKGEPEARDGRLSLLGTILRWFMKSSAAYSPRDALDHLDFLARVFWLPREHAKGPALGTGREKAPDPREGTSGKARWFLGQRSSVGLVG